MTGALSATLFQALIEHSPEVTALLAPDSTFLYVSPAIHAALGFRPEELVGRPASVLHHADDHASVARIFEDVTRRPATDIALECAFRHKDGSTRWLQTTVSTLVLEPGAQAIVVRFRDNPNQSQAASMLLERVRLATFSSEVSLALAQGDTLPRLLHRCCEAMVRNLHAAFARVWLLAEDRATLELTASAGLYTHLDGAHGRVPVGMFKIGLIAAERRPHLTNQVIGDARVNDQDWARDQGMVAFAGYPLIVEDRLIGVMAMFAREPLTEAALEAMASVANGIAVGVERKRAEHELALLLAREQHRAAQLDGLAAAALAVNASLSAGDMLQVITDQARALIGAHQAITSLTVNDDSAQVITGIALSDKYAAWRDYQEPINGSGIYALVSETNQPMRMTQAELERHPRWRGFGKEAGKHPPMRGWLVAPLIGRDGRNVGLIQLSDKYEGEFSAQDEAILVQLAQMASGAIQNARLYREAQDAVLEREVFLSIASHELRNPLAVLAGRAELLQRNTQRDNSLADRDRRAVTVIVEQAQRMNHLLEVLLDVSSLETGQFAVARAPLDLVALARRVVEDLRPTLDTSALLLCASDVEAYVSGDAVRLEQVLRNLLSNAIKYSPPDSTISVRVESDREKVRVSVIDQGIGIAPPALEQLFQRFYRVARQDDTAPVKGLGLGLYVVKEIVARHGGTVEVQSVLGAGSTFTVCLPRHG